MKGGEKFHTMNTECILGSAGTGKSTLLRKRIEAGENILCCATTGIAAVNLGEGVTTVHSALGFYDIHSLREAHKKGWIMRAFVNLAKKGIKTLVIDEVSMLNGEALSIIHDAALNAQQFLEARASAINHVTMSDGRSLMGDDATGILTSGDFLQLPPVPDDKSKPAQFAFESNVWHNYEANLTHLKKVWRQEDPKFLEALNLTREGRAVDAALALRACGVTFIKKENEEFDGITLFAVNSQVEAFNARRLAELPGDVVSLHNERWGKERGEWKLIPETLELKDGALVMVLSNDTPGFRYVNGDLATFNAKVQPDEIANGEEDIFIPAVFREVNYTIETKRGTYTGSIPDVIRRNVSYKPEDSRKDAFDNSEVGKRLDSISPDSKQWVAIYLQYMDAMTMKGTPYYDPRSGGTVIGEVRYTPLRLAYASSVHKTQGLTLDNVQININHFWFGQAGTAYVALSRCRSAQGITIVGDVGQLAKKIKTNPLVKRWI